MPALAGHHDRAGACLRGARALGGEQDPCLGFPAVAVEQVELARHLGRARVVLREQQLERRRRALHPAGGVDARAEPEAERLLPDLAGSTDATSMSARSPGLRVRVIAATPSRTIRRFSSRSGTTSHTVASAARSRSSSASAGSRPAPARSPPRA